jgi:polyvinyl alcohol dehydrogenase (cytochrome)
MRSPGRQPALPRAGHQRRGTIAALSLTLVLVSGCTVSVDWMSRLFDETHGGHTSDNVLTATGVGTLKQKWRLPAPSCNGVSSGAGWYATPVTFRNVIYIGSDFGCLYAINEGDGSIRWSKFVAFQPGQTCSQRLGIVSSIRVVDDGSGNAVLYFHSPDGYLYKLDANGNTIWRNVVQIPSSTQNDVYAWSSPTVANGKVIVGVSSNCDTPFVQGKVIAYDAANGNKLWTHKTIPDGFVGAGDWYDAAVDEAGDVYVTTGSTTDAIASAHPNTTNGFEQYSVLKLNGGDGTLAWKGPAPKFIGDPDYANSPVLFEGGGLKLVGATNKDGWFRVYRRDSGVEVWQAKVGIETPGASAALSGGGVWDGTQLFVMSNATTTGGTWAQFPAGVWSPLGGRLDPATRSCERRPDERGRPAVRDPVAVERTGAVLDQRELAPGVRRRSPRQRGCQRSRQRALHRRHDAAGGDTATPRGRQELRRVLTTGAGERFDPCRQCQRAHQMGAVAQ